MGCFLDELKYTVLLGKLFGYTLFSLNIKKSIKFYDYLYCVSYIIFFTSVLLLSVFVKKPYYTNLPYLLLFTEYTFRSMVIMFHYILILYFIINQRKLKRIIFIIDQYTTMANLGKQHRKFYETRIFFYVNLLFIIMDIIINYFRDMIQFLTYALPQESSFVLQYLILKILQEITLQQKNYNEYLFELDRNENGINIILFKMKFEQFNKRLKLTKKVTDIFGVSILINLINIFFILLSTVHFAQYLLRTGGKINLLENVLWTLITVFKLYYTFRCWTVLHNEVSFNKFNYQSRYAI